MRTHIRWLDRRHSQPAGTHKFEHSRLGQSHGQLRGYEIVERTKADIAKMKPI